MRRIKKAKITHLALCKKGANQLPVLYKQDGTALWEPIIKALPEFEEKGELLAVVYAPEHRDSQGDIADSATIRDMAHSFMRNGAALNIRHVDGTELKKEDAYVAENFIIQKSDERFDDMTDYAGNEVDVTGGWAVLIKVENPSLRALYKENGWNGVSLQGPAELEPETNVKKAADLFTRTRQSQGDDYDMKPEELAQVLEANNKTLATTLTTVLKEALKPETEQKPELKPETEQKPELKKDEGPKPPVFKGNPLKKEDIAAHKKALRVYELTKDIDWSNAESVQKYEEALAKFEAEETEVDEEEPQGSTVLKKGDRRSDSPADRAPTGKNSKVPASLQHLSLSKEEIEGFGSAESILAAMGQKAAKKA